MARRWWDSFSPGSLAGRLRRRVALALVGMLARVQRHPKGLPLFRDPLGRVGETRKSLRYELDSGYPDLPGALLPRPAAQRDAVFITARFRSGSTLLWQLFRAHPGCVSYYEPLNERRWFDPSCRGGNVDPSHRGVSDYWKEYEGMADLAGLYDHDFIWKKLWLGADDWHPRLRGYVDALIDKAPSLPVLQFNRVDFRLPWLKRNYPKAKLLHLYRHPRDQWCSNLGKQGFPREGKVADFVAVDGFYVLLWCRSLACEFPFLDPASAEHPYELFYYLWKLSYLLGKQQAHASLSYEALMAQPEASIRLAFEAAGIAQFDLPSLVKLISPAKPARWKDYADDAWFAKHEARCERTLADYFG